MQTFLETHQAFLAWWATGPTSAIRHVICDGLRRVWEWANTETDDGICQGINLEMLDWIAGKIPGFGQAMSDVGWAIYEEEGQRLELPNFSEHNWQPKKHAKTPAERKRAQRLRDKLDPQTALNRQRDCHEKTVTSRDIFVKSPNATAHMCTSPHDTEPALRPEAPVEKSEQEKKQELCDAISKACDADPIVSRTHIAKIAAKLLQADPPYTPDDVFRLPFVMAKRYRWFQQMTLGQIEKYIGILRPKAKANPYRGRDLWDQAERDATERARRREQEAKERITPEAQHEAIQTLLEKLKGQRDQCCEPERNAQAAEPQSSGPAR